MASISNSAGTLTDWTDSTATTYTLSNAHINSAGTAAYRYGWRQVWGPAPPHRKPAKPEDPDYVERSLDELRERIDGFRL